jgi:hypothetical protein
MRGGLLRGKPPLLFLRSGILAGQGSFLYAESRNKQNWMDIDMRFLLKILFAPILAALAVVTWFFVFVVGLSSGILCIPAAITVALSFATFENVCYLIQNGADRFSFIFFRGFGTGAMHVLCGLIVGGGLTYTWRRTWLKVAGTCGLLGAAITLHAIYNLLIAYGGAAQYIAYALPVLLVAAGRLSAFRLSQRK